MLNCAMKPLYAFLLFFISTFSCFSQSPLPEFGVFTDEEKALTECSFDTEADAIVLFDDATSDYDDQHRLITRRRIRIKVLKEKGIRYADVEIPYYSEGDFEYLSDIAAIVGNTGPDGNLHVQEVDRKQVFRQKINQYYSAVKFAIPNVKVGSIIEYQYTSIKKHYGGLEDWEFQREIPTRHSRYTLSVLPNAEFAYRVHNKSYLPINIKSEKNSGRILFEMHDIGGLRNEPYMDSRKDYLQRVEFQLSGYQGSFGDRRKYMTTWNEVVRELMVHPGFGRQLNKRLAVSDAFMKDIQLMASPLHKMAAVYRYVQNNLTWNGIGGKFADNVKEAWEKKKGSNPEINLILINLLEEAGLEVYPLLVSERGHGKVNPDYPFIDQFNTVMAYVVIGKDYYVLDGASYYTPPTTIPFSVVNTMAFVVNRKKGGIITLTEERKMNRDHVTILAKVNPDGLLAGNAIINSYDYSRIPRERSYRRNKSNFGEAYFLKNIPGLKMDSLQLDNLDNDTLPLIQQFNFSMPVTNTGDYHLLRLNLFTGLENNPFISDTRFTNIDYGCRQLLSLNALVTLPGDWQPETLPRDVKLIMPDTSISITRLCFYEKENNRLSVRYTVKTDRPVFPADEYPAVKEFYKKMTDILNEQIVLRKKTAARP